MDDSKTGEKNQTVIVRIDELAWFEGMKWALKGGSTFENPYPLGSEEAFSWLSGYIETAKNTKQRNVRSQARWVEGMVA